MTGPTTADPGPPVLAPPHPTGGARAARSTAWLVPVVAFVVVAAGLLWRNRDVFRVPLYEVGDAAANSLLINDAKALDLLVGHYSRVGFNHPGPAALYLQALGEALFTDLLGLTPAAHNGQVLAVMLLHAAVLAAVVAVVHRWSGQWPVAATALAVALAWYATHQYSLAGPWIPVLVIAPFLLLLVAAASVAAGNAAHLWLLAATGGLLVHAHVAFVLFVTGAAGAAVVTWAVTQRLSPAGLLRRAPRAWAVGAAVVALFLAPIVANTVLNWPGELPKYVSYSGEQSGVETSLAAAVVFTRQFWTSATGAVGNAVPVLLLGAATAAALLAPRRLRAPLLFLTAITVLAEVLFVVYALVGIDDLGQSYVGSFGLSLPPALLLVVGVATVARVADLRLAGRLAVGAPLGVAAVLVAAALSTAPAFAVRPEFSPVVPEVVEAVEAAADREPLVLDIEPTIEPFLDGTALLLQAEREGVEACVVNAELSVQVTPERMCSPDDLASGQRVELRPKGSQPDPTTRIGFSDVTVLP